MLLFYVCKSFPLHSSIMVIRYMLCYYSIDIFLCYSMNFSSISILHFGAIIGEHRGTLILANRVEPYKPTMTYWLHVDTMGVGTHSG